MMKQLKRIRVEWRSDGKNTRSLLLLLLCLIAAPLSLLAGSISGTLSQSSTATIYPDGALVYVKLVQNGTVLQVLQPDPIAGSYTFSGVAAGTYTVVVSATAGNFQRTTQLTLTVQ